MKKIYALVVSLLLIVASCSAPDSPSVTTDEFEVTLEEAKLIASNANNLDSNLAPIARKGKSKKVRKSIQINDNSKPILHVLEYEDSGFLVVSGDKRESPVLAYSDNADFSLDSIPQGIALWFEDIRLKVSKIRKENGKQDAHVKEMWDSFNPNLEPTTDPDDTGDDNPGNPAGTCNYETSVSVEKGPLLTMRWGQGCGYNNNCPIADGGPCGRAWAGCVAVAMAQVMRFHQFPSNYTWVSMPNLPSRNSDFVEISRLMRDIGDDVSMNYGADGSSADTKEQVASSFVNDFGYSSAQYLDYEGTSNFFKVEDEIKYNRPVIFRGGDIDWKFFGLIPVYSNGHAWVCDGYRKITYPCASYLYLHMNWGWNGTYDGWFAYNNFNPGGNTFNYKSGVVVNIKP